MISIIGYGAHGQDIFEIWEVAFGGPIQLLDEELDGFPSPAEKIPSTCYLGPYPPHVRWEMASRLSAWYPAPPLIHPSVHPGRACALAGGVVVARNAVLDHHVHLGVHTHVNYGAVMTRCSIGDFSTISPGVIICGDVTIGHQAFVGAGAVIANLVTIGNSVTIGAGSVVLEDVPDGTTVVGNPARRTGDWR